MGKRVKIAVCLSFGAAFAVGAGCASVPDNRKTQPFGYGQDAGQGSGGESGSGNGGASAGGGGGGKSGTGGSGGIVGSGGTGSGGLSGTGGDTGSGGAAGGAGGAGGTTTDSGAPVGIPCGSVRCSDRKVGGANLTACCAGKNKDACGFETAALGTTTCIGVNQPGGLDPTCADTTVGSVTLKGCCRPNATCGFLAEPAGGPHYGCVDPTEVDPTATTTPCTPPTCVATGQPCTAASNCCAGGAGLGLCLKLAGAASATCTQQCVTNTDCPSGCCVPQPNGAGACAPAASCSPACDKADEACDTDADCCSGLVCAPNSDFGPRLCRPPCTMNSDCTPELCVKDAGGRATCSTSHAGLCSDSCETEKNNGSCDDGGPGSDYAHYCALGTDCTDCGPRLGGTAECSDSCTTQNNGKCEDGGGGAVAHSCALGTDCKDCGPRLGLCANSCGYAHDGECDDGGPKSTSGACSLGTDCADCGERLVGRGQAPCDGSHGYRCVPEAGTQLGYWNDGCQCSDCAWDAGPLDCKPTTSKCNGTAISACCAPGNPCNLDGDGVCDCGGWCFWEKKDCGPGASGMRCDGASDYYYPVPCNFTNPSAWNNDGACDCNGACSWESANDCLSLGVLCTDTCATKHNGICADGGLGSVVPAVCTKGTDCADCGPR